MNHEQPALECQGEVLETKKRGSAGMRVKRVDEIITAVGVGQGTKT